uniref:Uncharacterized protein n=1 Tax=Arundo donax TaxID=35708 RepID=A0A0A9C191_ARUDO
MAKPHLHRVMLNLARKVLHQFLITCLRGQPYLFDIIPIKLYHVGKMRKVVAIHVYMYKYY